jgi:hypothetical protein
MEKMTPNYYKNFLPSKKIQLTILVVIVVFLAYFIIPKISLLIQGRIHPADLLSTKAPAPLLATKPVPSSFDKDSDGDGIADWKEVLFGLNPNSKDSDGDGITDELPTVDGASVGDVVSVGGSDKLALNVYASLDALSTSIDDPNNTLTNEEKVQKVTSEQMLAYAQSVEDNLKKYSAVDFTLVSDDQKNIDTYTKRFISLAAKSQDPAEFAKSIYDVILTGKGDGSKEIAFLNSMNSSLLDTPVPTSLSELHLSLLNASYVLLQLLEAPKTNDETEIYVRALIAQKNINLVQKIANDVATFSSSYSGTN